MAPSSFNPLQPTDNAFAQLHLRPPPPPRRPRSPLRHRLDERPPRSPDVQPLLDHRPLNEPPATALLRLREPVCRARPALLPAASGSHLLRRARAVGPHHGRHLLLRWRRARQQPGVLQRAAAGRAAVRHPAARATTCADEPASRAHAAGRARVRCATRGAREEISGRECFSFPFSSTRLPGLDGRREWVWKVVVVFVAALLRGRVEKGAARNEMAGEWTARRAGHLSRETSSSTVLRVLHKVPEFAPGVQFFPPYYIDCTVGFSLLLSIIFTRLLLEFLARGGKDGRKGYVPSTDTKVTIPLSKYRTSFRLLQNHLFLFLLEDYASETLFPHFLFISPAQPSSSTQFISPPFMSRSRTGS